MYRFILNVHVSNTGFSGGHLNSYINIALPFDPRLKKSKLWIKKYYIAILEKSFGIKQLTKVDVIEQRNQAKVNEKLFKYNEWEILLKRNEEPT